MSDTLQRTAERTAHLPVVNCFGSPQERGEAHGEALRPQIAEGLGRWAEALAAARGLAPDAYIAGFVRGTEFLPAIRRWTPGLLEELNGIVRGAGQSWEWMYAYNLLDEEWTWAKSLRQTAAPGCTAAGFVPDDGPPVLAQTMDIPSVHDGSQAVLRIDSSNGTSRLVFTYAGMIGLTGCSTDGLALVVNNLETLPTSATGLPVAFVLRGILDQRTLAEAVAFTRNVPHATGQHYGLAAPDGLASVEGCAAAVTVATEAGQRLLHTNHPLSANDIAEDADAVYARSRTRERLAYLQRETAVPPDASRLQAILCDRTVPISLAADRPFMTFGAVVYECDAPARMWVAPGPPHETPFTRIDW